MKTPIISLLYAMARRPNALQIIEEYTQKAHDKKNFEFVVVDDSDKFNKEPFNLKERVDLTYCKDISLIYRKAQPREHRDTCCVDNWNLAAELATGDIFVIIADDYFPPQDWDKQIRDKIKNVERPLVLAVSDGLFAIDGESCTHPVCTRAYWDKFGYFFHPEYISMYCDNDFMDTARKYRAVIKANDIVFDHRHAKYKEEYKGKYDNVNKEQESQDKYTLGKKVYNYRKSKGFNQWDYLPKPKIKNFENKFTREFNIKYHKQSWEDRLEEYGQQPRTDVLTALVLTIPGREEYLTILKSELERQGVTVLIDDRPSITIGEKRNNLIQACQTKYFTFIDDDDWISHNYVQKIVQRIHNGRDYDLINFYALFKSRADQRLVIYNSDFENENLPKVFKRKSNHLMCWRTEHVRDYKFQHINFGEDTIWAELASSKVERESLIDSVLYFYEFSLTDSASIRA